MTTTDALWGAKAILAYLRSQHGLAMTRETLYRKSKRARQPIPIRNREAGTRSHVYATRGDIDAWIAANYAM